MLNPQNYQSPQEDLLSRQKMEKTIRFFKDKGLKSIKEDDQASRRSHLYSNEMSLTAAGDSTYRANGSKYYIGNANEASPVSTFGKYKDTQDYVFCVVDSQHRHYKLIKKISTSGVRPAYVGELISNKINLI